MAFLSQKTLNIRNQTMFLVFLPQKPLLKNQFTDTAHSKWLEIYFNITKKLYILCNKGNEKDNKSINCRDCLWLYTQAIDRRQEIIQFLLWLNNSRTLIGCRFWGLL